MKKLIPMMAVAAVAFGAFADKTPIKSQGFEGATAGAVTDLDALTKSDADLVWKTEDTGATLTVAAYGEGEAYAYGDQDKYFGDTNTQKLEIDSSKPVYAGYGASTGILEDGTYIDTLVKFTVTDQDTAVETDTNAKLAIWAQATNAEGTENVLKVMCGQLDGEVLSATAQTLELNKKNIAADKWYRLTVRTAMTDTVDQTGEEVAAFEIYVDGEKLKADAQETFLACVSGSTIEGVGFKGNGAVDDVAITDNDNAPEFAAITASTMVTCGDGIVSFKVGETTYTAAASVKIPAAITAEDITDIVTINGVAATVTANEGTLAITANAALEGGYLTIAEALEKGATTLNLVADLTETFSSLPGVAGEVTLNLAGKTLTLVSEDQVAFDVTGKLTVITSAEGGKIVSLLTGEDAAIFFPDDGAIVFGAAEGDYGVTVDGAAFYDTTGVTINKGSFSAEENAESGLEDVVATGYELKEVEGYLVVTKSGPAPTTYKLTLPTVTGATAAVTAGGEEVDDLTAIEEGTEVTVTWTVSEGYKLVSGNLTETITMDSDKEATAITVKALATVNVTVDAAEGTTVTGVAAGEATEDDTLEFTVTVATGYKADTLVVKNGEEVLSADGEGKYTITVGTTDVAITTTVEADAQPLPGDDYMAEGEKKAYDEWATATGVTAEDTALAADLAVAFRLNVTGTETPADAIAAAEDKATDLVKKIDLAKLASGEDALAAVKAELPAGLQAVLKPVEKAEIDTTASLFRLVIEPVNAN